MRILLSSLPRPIQCLFVALLNRARDPEPEAYYTNHQDATGTQVTSWGWLPELALTSTLGMLSIAYAFANSRNGGTGLRAFLYPGLLLIYTPIAVRLISPAVSRTERIILLCIAGVCCYLIKVMLSPLYFSSFDEFLHWRTADDIIRSGHLFSKNAMLPVSPYYPGLEIVTNALSTLSRLDNFNSGLVVIGVARLLMILTLFALNERILKSARMASIATILYIVNPEFLLFNSLFAYEVLAIPLAAFVLLAIVSYQPIPLYSPRFKSATPSMILEKTDHGDLLWITLTAWIALVALALTHHMTDFFLDGVLILWAVIYRFLHLTPIHQLNLARTALLGVLISVAWIGFNGNPVVHYISSTFGDTL
ncbi:MAG TPA: hypothetical protein VHV10_19475, partial [Ktedonobacteraceae bacterium]|nr:hypothetical protein [Ktedonobacteraceae bacterium]